MNAEENNVVEMGKGEISVNCIVVHGREGPYLMCKCKWPNLQEKGDRVESDKIKEMGDST